MMKFRLLVTLLLLAALRLPAELQIGQLFEMAKQFELAATPEPPLWSKRNDEPLFRVAWLSDLHITDAKSLQLCRTAMEAVKAEKPDAVFITGDNCGMAATPQQNSDGVARHKFLKSVLDEYFKEIPLYIIPGDNWPRGFSKVFGSSCRSFSIKGYRFITLTPSVQGKIDGCAILGDDVWQWLDKELNAAAEMPVIVLTHFPLMPASFLDAPRLQQRFRNSTVVGVLSGHLHLDLSAKLNRNCVQWMAPAIGRSHRPGFKVISFYKDAAIAAAYEWQPEKEQFCQVNKFQRLSLPEKLQISASTRDLPPSSMIPAEIKSDTTLDAEKDKLEQNIQQSLIRFGMQRFMPQ